MPSKNPDLPTVARRLAAGQMLLDGASVAEVARSMHMSENTIRKYRQLIADGGLDSLRNISVGGRTSALDKTALAWIADALRGSPREHGFDSDLWTNARLRTLIATHYGVQYSRVYTWQIATNIGLAHRLSKSRR